MSVLSSWWLHIGIFVISQWCVLEAAIGVCAITLGIVHDVVALSQWCVLEAAIEVCAITLSIVLDVVAISQWCVLETAIEDVVANVLDLVWEIVEVYFRVIFFFEDLVNPSHEVVETLVFRLLGELCCGLERDCIWE